MMLKVLESSEEDDDDCELVDFIPVNCSEGEAILSTGNMWNMLPKKYGDVSLATL